MKKIIGYILIFLLPAIIGIIVGLYFNSTMKDIIYSITTTYSILCLAVAFAFIIIYLLTSE